MSKNVFADVRKDVAKFIPEKGFCLVGIDSYEVPGEAAYNMGVFDTRAEAEAAKKAAEKEARDNGEEPDKMHIYGPGDA